MKFLIRRCNTILMPRHGAAFIAAAAFIGSALSITVNEIEDSVILTEALIYAHLRQRVQ